MNMTTRSRLWRMTVVTALAAAMLPLAWAQAAKLKMPDFSGLASKAKESVDIDLDKDMIGNAMGFMAGDKADPQLTEALKGLEHVMVKVFSFEKAGVYSMRDIEDVVRQVETGGWKKLLSVRDGEDRVEMWMRDGTKDGGMFFVAAEPKELVMINIAGKVDLATLAKLLGHLGVPNLGVGGPAAPPIPPAPPVPPVAPAR
jgi:hypothetical protein